MNATPKTYTASFFLLAIGNFIVVSVYFLFMTTMAYYAVFAYGAESALAGLTASIFLVGGVLGRIITGRFSGRIDLKRLALISLAVQLAMCLLYFVDFFGLAFLITIRLIHGISFGVANTVLPALAIDPLPPEKLGEGTGYYMLSNSLGVGIGPLMSILIVLGIDYNVLFAITSGLSLLALLLTIPVRSTPRRASSDQEIEMASKDTTASNRRKLLESILDLSTFKLSVFMFLVAFAYSSLNAFINSYAIEKEMGFYAPFVFLVYSGVLLLSRPATGKLMDRYGENAVLYPSIISMALGLILAAFVANPVMLLCCGIFMATGFGTCMSTGQAAATKISTCGDTSKTISTFFLLCDGGCGIGPFVLGFVVSGFSYEAMYVLCAVIAVAAVIYYHWVHGRKANLQPK